MKITHIDMSDAIKQAYSGLPVFPDTAPLPDKEGLPRPQIPAPTGQSVFEAREPRTLPLVTFPEFSVRHARRMEGAVSWASHAIGLSRADDELETVSIPEAETYGVDAAHALAILDGFCEEGGDVCTDNSARRLLSYLVGLKEVCRKTKEGDYVNSVGISLVERVYLTRSIVQERSTESTAGVQAQIRTPPGVATSAVVVSGNRIALHHIFIRPLAIGIRAVHMQPQKGKEDNLCS